MLCAGVYFVVWFAVCEFVCLIVILFVAYCI